MKTYSTLKCDLEDRILTVRLHRPEQLNAFTGEMADELVNLFTEVNENDDVGALIVTGEGRAFCAGMDLSVEGNVFDLDESKTPDMDYMREGLGPITGNDGVRDSGGRVTLSIYNCRKPVIAAINGPAVGIGATMTLAMDIRLASEKARVGFVFGKLGIVPEACSSWFLPRLVGVQQALEWVLSADIFDAAEGLRGGLFRSVHAPEDLLNEARALARKFIENRSPVAVALARQMLWRNAAQDHPIEAHRVDSLAMFYTSIGDGKEGVAAFLEKRAPDFAGKASHMPDFFPWSSK
ncbi:crotonase/enoyl-CoA hydratase family protein [Kordiimonas marina]|uniref:crotonase/enoyl-CoA hydratase family protein n=1 Tax=Kordiimonas marina TaxID=2872312 RepID=UPI001FF43EE5|nr:crotonase/enoyl-CoA hydratase family protein [Kordiimonas marina]MCJ9427796.1 crotonase/enoyl-CoA hydratase family protein [Kordiimonas marina]